MRRNKKVGLVGIGLCCATFLFTLMGESPVYATQQSINYIGEEKAKLVAMEHAGINESEISFIISKFEYDDRSAEYDVEFWSGLVEYDYEIDAITGAIKSYDYDIERKLNSLELPVTEKNIEEVIVSIEYITSEQAKSIALADAGVKDTDISYIECEFDYDDGFAEYGVEWKIGKMEYEYTISALDGSVWERDVEYDD